MMSSLPGESACEPRKKVEIPADKDDFAFANLCILCTFIVSRSGRFDDVVDLSHALDDSDCPVQERH
jgi:hypothetical protein